MHTIFVITLAIGVSGALCTFLDIEYGLHPAIFWAIGTMIGFIVGLFSGLESYK